MPGIKKFLTAQFSVGTFLSSTTASPNVMTVAHGSLPNPQALAWWAQWASTENRW